MMLPLLSYAFEMTRIPCVTRAKPTYVDKQSLREVLNARVERCRHGMLPSRPLLPSTIRAPAAPSNDSDTDSD